MSMGNNQPETEDLARFSESDLYERRVDLEAQAKELGREIGEIDKIVASRFEIHIKNAFDRKDEPSGKVEYALDSIMSAVATASKSVSWDQARLKAMAASMDWPTVQHFFTITFKVTEKVFGGLPPDDPRKKLLTDARTVKYGDPKISLVKAD